MTERATAGATSVEGLRTADIVDAMGRLHRHRCHLLDLVSPTPGRRLFGPAVTISYFPTCGPPSHPSATTSRGCSTRPSTAALTGTCLSWPATATPIRHWAAGQSCHVSKTIGSPAFSPTGGCVTSPSLSTTTLPSTAVAKQRGGAVTPSPPTRRTFR